MSVNREILSNDHGRLIGVPTVPQIPKSFGELAVSMSVGMRRAVRPETYSQVRHEFSDRKTWKNITARVLTYAQERGDDFFFIQVGANDGLKSDPIRQYVKQYEWSGLLVEPVPHYFKKLQHNYKNQPNLSFANAAISHCDGTATLFAAKERPDGKANPLQGLSSFHESVIRKHSWMTKSPEELIEPIEVPTMTWNSLIDKYAVDGLDYVVVDTEGHDKKVVEQIDFVDGPRPKFILYEHGHLNSQDQAELSVQLQSNGYRLTSLRRDTFAESI
jgi:FkbM family methyltransferase